MEGEHQPCSNAYRCGRAVARAHAIESLQRIRHLRIEGGRITREGLFGMLRDKSKPRSANEVRAFFQALDVGSEGWDLSAFVEGLLDELARREEERRQWL